MRRDVDCRRSRSTCLRNPHTGIGDTTMRTSQLTHTAALGVAAIIAMAGDTRAQDPSGAGPAKNKPSGRYADVNGIKLYYEIHGAGRPLVLLHGGLGAIEMFGPNLPALAERHRVVAVDLQGHGRTADVDRPISVETMAEDIAALIKKLGLEKPDVMGYSLGGGVALLVAARHPELVRKLVAVA